jgi:filamentous hemagglutinin family protein
MIPVHTAVSYLDQSDSIDAKKSKGKREKQKCLILPFAFCLLPTAASAQIIPDTTLPANSIVTPQGFTSIITGGTPSGGNLFHSFEQFSVLTNNTAYFNNAADIQNIISRVTGGSVSNIDGQLKANGTASLFVLNPNGIIFGPNATLDMGGSFVATTASSIKFAEGNEFSVVNSSNTPPLLTISLPSGLQFGDNPGRIIVQGSGQGIRLTTDLIDTTVGLRVQPNKTLALVGGDLALEGGTLKTAGGRIELGSVGANSFVSLTPIDRGYALGYDGVSSFRDIQLSGSAAVDASGLGGGDIQVRGRQVTLKEGSQLEASTLGAEPGGTLNVTASESVELIGSAASGQYVSSLLILVYPEATGAGGNLTVDTGRLIVRDGAQVSASTFDAGAAGNLVVKASEAVELIGTSADGQWLSGLSTLVLQEATGVGGNLTVETQQLILRNGAQIGAGTYGAGAGSTLAVSASESIELIGTSADGQYSSSLYTAVEAGATGAGGNLTLSTGRLILRDGAVISAATLGEGSGGTLEVNASDSVELIGTSADGQVPSLLSAQSTDTAEAGDLKISTGLLKIRDGAQVSVSSEGSGDAGNLEVQAHSIFLDKKGQLIARTASGNGGNITLNVRDLLLQRHDSQIATDARGGTGNGGNIVINGQFIVAVPNENSDITANAVRGRGGNINITTSGIYGQEFRPSPTPRSDITASSDFGVNGTVQINTPDVDPSRGLTNLPQQLVDVSGLVDSSCAVAVSEESNFVVTGRGGVPPSPNETLRSARVLVDLGSNEIRTQQSAIPSPQGAVSINPKLRLTGASFSNPSAPLVEATGWVRGSKGEVILTAQPPTLTSHGSWLTPANCNGG